MSLDELIEERVAAGVERALRPWLRRLADPEPLVWTVPQVAKVLATSPDTVRRLIADGVLPTVPHIPRVLVPRAAVEQLVAEASAAGRRPTGRWGRTDERVAS